MFRPLIALALPFSLVFADVFAFAEELTVDYMHNAAGDGPDGKGNTADDTWQFWFELAHAPNQFHLLSRHSTQVPQDGIKGKVYGPIAGSLPNPADTQGFIYHSDWDGRFEGAWGDKKTNLIYLYPYVEKNFHGCVALTYRVPETGKYNVSATMSDEHVWEHPKHDGMLWRVEVADGGKLVREIAKSEPFGDKAGRPDTSELELEGVELEQGQLLRIVCDPIGWWGSDLMGIKDLKIEKAE